MAARVLKGMGLSLEEVRCVIEEIIADRDAPGRARARAVQVKQDTGVERVEPIPFTPRVRKALTLSLREAVRLGHDYISTEHLLLGVLGEGGSAASQVLTKFGIAADQVRRHIDRELARREVTQDESSDLGAAE
nr:Clp protease N-terminal domain-containing protein [Nonomuraea sediminis]